MSEQINPLNIPSIQNKKQVAFQQNSAPAQGVTTMQGAPKSVGDTQLGNRVKNSSEMTQSPYTIPVTAGLWYGIAQGMDKFNEKCCGEYDKSILGKVTGAADRLSDKFTGSKLYKSRFSQWLGKRYNTVAAYLDRITSNPKNRLLYAIRNHKTNPECKLVKIPAAGLDGFALADTKQVFEEFLNPAKHAVQLKQYGKDAAYIQKFLDSVKNLPKSEKLKMLQLEELKFFGVKKADLVGKSAEEIAKMLQELKVTKGLGFKSFAQYEKFLDDEYALKHLDELANTLKKGNQKLKVLIWKKDGFFGKIFSHFFGREIGVSELANKMSLCSKTGAKTKLGKYAGKSFGYLVEGGTNRFAGGKLAVLMQAWIFADMLIHTFKAPKGEKGKTFIERAVNDFTYFLAMPLGIWAMHKAGGLKYLGMSAEQVKAYRQNLKLFNANHASYGKKMFKMRKKVLDRQLMAGVKNPFLWLIKKGANILTVGIERVRPYVSKDKLNLNLLRKSKFWGKNIIGYPLRFAIPLWLISPILAKWTTKATHKIFGRPTESVLDENNDDPKEQTQPEAAKNQPAMTGQTPPVQPTQQTVKPTVPRNPNEYASGTNLIKMAANGQKPAPARTYIPSPECKVPQGNTDPNKEPEPLRTYIPNPQGMIPQGQDLSGIDAALAQADNAEKYVQDILKMN